MNNDISNLLNWNFFAQPLPLIFLLAIVIIVALAWLVWKKREYTDFIIGPTELGATDTGLKLFYGWVPVILGLHVAIALLVNGVQGQLFSTNLQLEGLWANWLGLAEIMIALALFYGVLTRPAAFLIAILWFLGLGLFGLKSMLESIQYLGFASFFFLAGRGPYAIDRILFPNLEPNESYANYALLTLRICVGLNLIVYGITEKLANNFFTNAFFNFLDLSNEHVILLAGALKVLAGLLIVFGIFPRTVIVITLICINASLTNSNWEALLDYLPIYGALAVLLVWEPHNYNQKLIWVQGLRKKYE